MAVINEEFVRRHFAGENPVGRHLLLPGFGESYPAEIVGVVRNGKYRRIGEDQQAAVYEPFLQRGNRGRFVHVLVRANEATEAGPEGHRTRAVVAGSDSGRRRDADVAAPWRSRFCQARSAR